MCSYQYDHIICCLSEQSSKTEVRAMDSNNLYTLMWSYQYDRIHKTWSGACWLFKQLFKTDAWATDLFDLLPARSRSTIRQSDLFVVVLYKLNQARISMAMIWHKQLELSEAIMSIKFSCHCKLIWLQVILWVSME